MTTKRRLIIPSIALLCSLGVVVLIVIAPNYPVALIRVVDEAGLPVAGAIVKAEGLRTKPGTYQGDWYGWRTEATGVPNPPVTTDEEGHALVPYPKFVFESIETGKLCLSVDHPDYVPDRPERIVATAPPAGAPWRVRLDDLLNRLRQKSLIAKPDPVVMKRGAVLEVAVEDPTSVPEEARLFVQTSALIATDTGSWIRPEKNRIFTRRLPGGTNSIRAVRVTPDGRAWFSDVVIVASVPGQTNRHLLALKPGVTVRGALDESVPRPVAHGRVIAHVWPRGFNPPDRPPQWHQWSPVAQDGSFAFHSLPAGNLEIVVLCEGYVSKNGPGLSAMRYPQKHVLGTNDLVINIGMEPTARLEVLVKDDEGNPLADARVSSWCNVRYGEWSATILASDCYNMTDRLWNPPSQDSARTFRMVPDFEGVSDASGRAVISNLPATAGTVYVEHEAFELPALAINGRSQRREAPIILEAGRTNRTAVKLEPKEARPIAHY